MRSRISAAVIAALTVVLTMSLSGCNSETPNSAPVSNPVSSPASDNSGNTEQVSEPGSEDSKTEPELSDDVKRLIEEYPCVLEYTKRDGTVLSPNDIINVQFPNDEIILPKVTYGSAEMSYGLPFFATTLDNDDWMSDGDGFSNAIDWLVYRRDEVEESFAGIDFEVKPGDKLENGLVVKSAETVYEAMPPEALEEWKNDPYASDFDITDLILKTKIEFDGTLTLEGILFKYARDEDYFAAPNDVFFYPDTTKNKFVPMWHKSTHPNAALLDPDFAVIYSDQYYLGNLDGYADLSGADYDVDEVLGDRNYARVKITLKNICIGSIDRTTQSPQRAQIADVERIG